MNWQKLLLSQREEEKLILEEKIFYLETKISLDEKIKSLISEIKDIKEKKAEILKISNSTYNILKRYIAELNLKIFPNTLQKDYGEKNVKLNLLNLSMLSNLQRIKADVFVKHKYKLEDKALDILQKEEMRQTNYVKSLLKEDKFDVEIMENEKDKLSMVKDDFRDVGYNVEKYKFSLKQYKMKYDMLKQINASLQKVLDEEKIKYEKLCKKNNNKKHLNLKININDSLENYKGKNRNKNKIGNIRCFSDNDFFCVKNIKRKSMRLFKAQNTKNSNKKNEININPFIIKNYKGYKSPLLFLKPQKIFEKNINKSKPVNAYDFLNIFSNNKKYDSISNFIDSFNTINSSKLSFYNTQEMKSTKVNSISSNVSNTFKKKLSNRKEFYSPQKNENEKNGEMYMLRDYLYELIDERKNIIKELSNKKAEEIRSNYQIKLFISKCIGDINNEMHGNYNLNQNENENEINANGEDNKESAYNIDNNNKLFLLSYIFDNCFCGVNSRERILFTNHRNKIKNKNNHSFEGNNNNGGNNNIRKRCFSSTNIRNKK